MEENELIPAGPEQAADPAADTAAEPEAAISAEQFVAPAAQPEESAEAELRAIIEAIVYITNEPLTAGQIASGLGQPVEKVEEVLASLVEAYTGKEHGLLIQEVAGGYKMGTKPEHNDALRQFVRSLKPPLKLSLAALETLAVIAYKQPITAPEVMEIRGVQGAGVLKTLLDRRLIATAGRKQVIGKPILYKTTKEFLIQFGLKDLSELPTLKEFEELRRLAVSDEMEAAAAPEGDPAALLEVVTAAEKSAPLEVQPAQETAAPAAEDEEPEPAE